MILRPSRLERNTASTKGHDHEAHNDQPVEAEQCQKGSLVVRPQEKCARLAPLPFDRLGDEQVSASETVFSRGWKLRQRFRILRPSKVGEQ